MSKQFLVKYVLIVLCHDYIYFTMQKNVKAIERNERLAKMRATLSVNPLFTATTVDLQKKIQKNKSRRGSTAYTSKQFTISKQFDLDDIQDLQIDKKFYSLFKDKYQLISKIGQGSNGIVRKCRQKETNQIAAVKTFRLDQQHFIYLKKNFKDIKDLKHENIIKYKALFFEKQNQTCHLVMQYHPFPNLLHLKYKEEQFLKEIIYQILVTIQFLHKNKICHRDIKPENILYDEINKKIKLIDFGISKNLMERGRRKEMLTITGTLYYRAPEMFDGGGYDEMVDIWALGVTMFKLMTGRTPFQSQYHTQTIENIKRGEIPYDEAFNNYSKTPKNLISRFLKPKKERLTATQALKDFWFIDIINQKNEQQIKSMTILSKKNFSFIDQMNSGPSNLTLIQSKYQRDKFQKQMPFKSLKQIMNIQEEQSMIYGGDQDKMKQI